MRDPITIQANQFEEGVAEERFGKFRHGEARGGAIQAGVIGHGTEQRDAAIGSAMRFEAFEEGLAVVKCREGGGEFHGAEGDDTGLVPFAIVPIDEEHVVAVVGAEGGVFAEVFG